MSRKFDREFAAKLGLMWFLQIATEGKTRKQIAMANKKAERTVKKYIDLATNTMIDAAQATIMERLFPQAIRLLEADMQVQLAKAAKGEQPDLKTANKLLNGMFIYNRPQLKTQLEDPDDESIDVEQIATLADIYKKRIKGIKPQKAIEGEVKEVEHGDEDQESDEDGDA